MLAMISRESLTQILNSHGSETEWVDFTILAHFERISPKASLSEAGQEFLDKVSANCFYATEDTIKINLPAGENHGGLFIYQR
jgi:hypothetical protein